MLKCNVMSVSMCVAYQMYHNLLDCAIFDCNVYMQ